MKLLMLFILTSVGGGIGTFGGIFAGAAVGPGVGILLQFVLGTALLAAAVLAAERLDYLRRHQRAWTLGGGVLGVGMAALVTLSTLSSPVAAYLAPGMIGLGATLGSLIGKSAHERLDLT